MTLIASAAPNGLAIDTSARISPAAAIEIAAAQINGQPILGIGRYVSLHEPEPSSDITSDELLGITEGAGLGCWLVQHVFSKWSASAALGTEEGKIARDNALAVGYPLGCHLFLDLEGCQTVGQVNIDYCNAWAAEVIAAFPPGLYRGFASGISSAQAYVSLPTYHLYWKAPGPWDVDIRGCAIVQGMTTTVVGIPADPDTLSADKLGGRLTWAKAA